jgi:hypothetical protein
MGEPKGAIEKQEDGKFQASLGYLVRPCLEKSKRKKRMNF